MLGSLPQHLRSAPTSLGAKCWSTRARGSKRVSASAVRRASDRGDQHQRTDRTPHSLPGQYGPAVKEAARKLSDAMRLGAAVDSS